MAEKTDRQSAGESTRVVNDGWVIVIARGEKVGRQPAVVDTIGVNEE